MSAIRPATKPLKSAAVHPLAELGVGVGGMHDAAGRLQRRSRAVPWLCPGFQSHTERVVVRGVGETSLNVGDADEREVRRTGTSGS